MRTVLHRLANEPALLISAVEALAAIGGLVGFDMTPEQVGYMFTVIALVTGFATRQTVFGPTTVDDLLSGASVMSRAGRRRETSGRAGLSQHEPPASPPRPRNVG